MKESKEEIKKVLFGNDPKKVRALFAFDSRELPERVTWRFGLWARFFFPDYFSAPDAPFHDSMDALNLKAYRGEVSSFSNIAFRDSAKTARTKLFLAFCILNDIEAKVKFVKVLAFDRKNAVQIVTDIYNMIVSPRILSVWPETFEKADQRKREEKQDSFTTARGVKIVADTVGVDQRGALQEFSRPQLIWFEDFENRKTLWSSTITFTIWANMEEARTGLAQGGACIYTCNYISEMGNVQRLVTRQNNRHIVTIQPVTVDGTAGGDPAWPGKHTREDIAKMREDDDDFEGERLCKPSSSKDVFFDRERLEKMPALQPERESAGFKIFRKFNPSHRYGSGHDVGGGVGLDSSTSVFIDFSHVPAQVVGVFKSNSLPPEIFGYEIKRETDIFGGNIAGIEVNYGDSAVTVARQEGVNVYARKSKDTKVGDRKPIEYGWRTTSVTKPNMLFALQKAISDGTLELNDPDLISECKGFTRNELLEKEPDVRLATRHFDLVMALAIAWQMKDEAVFSGGDDVEYITSAPTRDFDRFSSI